MNPSIPPEFYFHSRSTWQQWHAPLVHESGTVPFPMQNYGSWNTKQVRPLQEILLQQLLEHPEAIADSHISDSMINWLFYHFQGSGRLTKGNVVTLARNTETLDLSFNSNLDSSWLPLMQQIPALRYVITLLHAASNFITANRLFNLMKRAWKCHFHKYKVPFVHAPVLFSLRGHFSGSTQRSGH